ncbi:hypothetical protein [Phaeocystidibacter luteus]|nr:hypothetical protein [Phaeocystidibacter luteus]
MSTTSLFRDADNKLTQTQLNLLVKEIEFYKSLNGHYPSSLSQLDLEGSLVTIYEVYKSKLGSNRIEFYYEINEDGFYLFSRGFDGIEYTLDDVLPSYDTSNSIGYRLTSYHREIKKKHSDSISRH